MSVLFCQPYRKIDRTLEGLIACSAAATVEVGNVVGHDSEDQRSEQVLRQICLNERCAPRQLAQADANAVQAGGWQRQLR